MDLYYRHLSHLSSKTNTTEDGESEMITAQASRSECQSVHKKDRLQNGSDTGNHSEPGTLRLYSCPRSETESLLLNFYVNTIQQDKVYFLLDQGQNPVTFMLMAADTSPAIYIGILMYAADRLAQLDPRFSHVVMRYRHRTLMALRDLLIQQERSTRDILLVSMMLCTVEINDPHPSTWVVHFSAYRHAVQQRMARTTPHREDDYGYHLAYRFFTHHLIIAKTMFNVEEATQTFVAGSEKHGSIYDLASRWTATENLALEMDSDSLDIIDPYSNFSNGLLLLVNEVADLKALQASTNRLKHLRDKRKRESDLRTKSQRLEASLTNLRQVAPDWMKMSEHESMVALIEQVAEANRLATFILLLHEPYLPLSQHNAAIMSTGAGSSAEHESPASLSGNGYPTECRREEKERHVGSLLKLVNAFVASTSLLAPSWALWSTFIAGCCTERESNRVAVMDIFNTAIGLTQRPNLVSAFRVVQAVWRHRDLQADVTDVCVRTISRRRRREKQACGRQAMSSASQGASECVYEWQSVMDMIGERISPV